MELSEINKITISQTLQPTSRQNDPQEHIFVFLLLFSKLDAMPN
jgi:hypothetical protein